MDTGCRSHFAQMEMVPVRDVSLATIRFPLIVLRSTCRLANSILVSCMCAVRSSWRVDESLRVHLPRRVRLAAAMALPPPTQHLPNGPARRIGPRDRRSEWRDACERGQW